MKVKISVDEADILSLDRGQSAEISIESLGDRKLQGVVTNVDRTAQTSSSTGVTTYSAEISFAKEPGMLSGMSAEVVINIIGTEDVLLVPADAVQRTSASAFVYTAYDEETGEYQAQLLANNGEVLFTTSNSYSSKDSLKEAIKTISSLIHENGFLIRKDKQGRYQFVVTSSNGVLVLGESYSGGDSARSAANSVLCFLDQAEWLDPDVDPDLDLEMK